MKIAFTEAVKTVQQERGSRAAYAKVERAGGFHSTADSQLAAFLASIDTASLATVNAEGQPYIQHRGGPKGFIRVLDEHTLGFADFSGNRQYISTGNLRENDRVCLLLIDYVTKGRVKVWGRARAVPATPELVARLEQPGYRGHTEQVVLITIEAWDFNCPRHIPQKLDAGDVARALTTLQARIAELEAQNRALQEELVTRAAS